MKIFELPDGYKETREIDLKKNIKLAIFVSALSLALAGVVFFIGLLIMPIHISSVDSENPFKPLVTLFVILGLMIIYMILHEFVHGIFFKKYSGEKAQYGFTGLYAFAKSNAYYNKKEILIIGLSPIVMLGIVLLILNITLSASCFWYVFSVQILNISGAAGDLYVAYVLNKMPQQELLVKDNGASMTIYTK